MKTMWARVILTGFLLGCLASHFSSLSAETPLKVAALEGTWQRTSWGSMDLFYTVEGISPVVGKPPDAGHYEALEAEPKRMLDELVTGFMAEPCKETVRIFLAKVHVDWTPKKHRHKAFSTLAVIRYLEESGNVIMEMRYPLEGGHNNVRLTLVADGVLSAVSIGIDRGRQFRNTFLMTRAKK